MEAPRNTGPAKTMNKNVWPDRLFALDVSRAIAALSVVLWHWQHFAYKGSSLSQGFAMSGQPLYGILKLFYEKGYRGVDYFFVLSGFIFFWLYRESIQDRKTSGWSFFIQRFSRLYPLHFLTLIAVAALQLLYASREHISFVYPCNDLYHFFLNVVFACNWGLERGLSFNGPVWSVSVEVVLYFVFFLVAFSRKGGWLFSLSASILSFVIMATLSRHTVFKGLALFFLGGFVFHMTYLISNKKESLKKFVYSVAVVSWLIVIVDVYVYDMDGILGGFGALGGYLRTGHAYILFPSTVCGLALFEIRNRAFFRPVAWMGDISYSSYLLHFPLQLFFALAVSYGVLSPLFYRNPLYLLLYFVILVPLSYLTYRKFERPLQTIIRSKFITLKQAQPGAPPSMRIGVNQ